MGVSMLNELQTAAPMLLTGLLVTFKVLLCGVIGGLTLGTILALMRLSNKSWLAIPSKLYVNFFRSVPLLLVLLWFYFAVPMMYTMITEKYLTIDAKFTSCAVAFVMFEAAYFAEVVRAGIQSIGKGQINAAKALGMTYGQSMRLIILPQAFRKMLPLVLQQSIILFQDTTLVFAVGLVDLFRAAYVRGELMGYLEFYILTAGAVYFIISLTASKSVARLQKRLRT